MRCLLPLFVDGLVMCGMAADVALTEEQEFPVRSLPMMLPSLVVHPLFPFAQTGGQTDRQTDTQADRQTDRQTDSRGLTSK